MNEDRKEIISMIRESSPTFQPSYWVEVSPEELTDLLIQKYIIRPRYQLHSTCQALTKRLSECRCQARYEYDGVGLCGTHAKLHEAGKTVELAVGAWPE